MPADLPALIQVQWPPKLRCNSRPTVRGRIASAVPVFFKVPLLQTST
jgi:hypothetical protein